jgi:uncharacterized protein (TIGR02145 family)
VFENGNITNDQTWSYDDPISIDIESNGEYTVTNNPGGHLVSDSYPGTEEVHYNSSTNILTFQWVLYYHYACGGACYSGVTFQVMEYGDGEMTLFYNNGSGPAPQANSMFLSLDGWFPDLSGDVNEDGFVNVNDVVIAVNIVLGMSPFNELADINGDSIINVQDIILLVNIILWESEPEDVCEDIDGNVYETVQIGEQLWMAENLKVTHYNNGDEIPTGYSNEDWSNLETGAYAVYDDDPLNIDIYGNLYNWHTIADERGICPDGHHVPSDDEWIILEMFLGMSESEANNESCWDRGTDEGNKIKECTEGNCPESDYWIYNWQAITTNESGFTAFPGGYRYGHNDMSGRLSLYQGLHYSGTFWTSSVNYDGTAWYRKVGYSSSSICRDPNPGTSAEHTKRYGYSIRCLADEVTIGCTDPDAFIYISLRIIVKCIRVCTAYCYFICKATDGIAITFGMLCRSPRIRITTNTTT